MKRTYEVTVTNTGSIMVSADTPEQAYDIVLNMSRKEINERANLCGWEPSDVIEVTDNMQTDVSGKIPMPFEANYKNAFWVECNSKEEIFSVFELLTDNGYMSATYETCLYEQSIDALKEYYKNDMLWKPTCFFVDKQKKTFSLLNWQYIQTMVARYPICKVEDIDLT